MSTGYTLTDSLPKDSSSQRHIAWVNVGTSQLDYLLPAGIGAATVGGKITGALRVGSHEAGSKIEPTGGVGVALMAHFASNASPTAAQNAIHLRSDDRGQQYVSALSSTACAMSGSTETVALASGILYRSIIAACGAVSGGQVAILNGGTSLAHVVFGNPNETLPVIDFGTGACFSSLRFERRNTVGTIYVTNVYRNFGQ